MLLPAKKQVLGHLAGQAMSLCSSQNDAADAKGAGIAASLVSEFANTPTRGSRGLALF